MTSLSSRPRGGVAPAVLSILCALPAAAPLAQTLDDVVVTASRYGEDARRTLSDVTVIDREQLERHGGGSVLDALVSAGIPIAQAGGRGTVAGVFLNGTKNSQTVVLVDGVRIENPTAGGANLEFLPLATIERIEVLHGPASALYGSGAIGGVVQIFTRRAEGEPRVHASLGAGSRSTQEASAGYGGRAGDTRFSLNVARESTDGHESTRSTGRDFQADRDASRIDSFSGNIAHRIARGWDAGASLLVAEGRSEYDDAFSTPATAVVDHRSRTATAWLEGAASDRWQTRLRVGRSDIDYAFRAFAFAPRTSTTGWLWFNTVDTAAGRLSFGLERETQRIGGIGLEAGPGGYARSERTTDSLLLGFARDLGAHQLKLQARHDRIDDVDSATTGSLAYGYRLDRSWRLRASVATAFRAPTFDDLYNPFGSNPALRPERARAWELGADWSEGASRLRLTAFAQRIRDAIELDGNFVPTNLNRARVRGLRAEASTRSGALALRAALALQHAEGERLDAAGNAGPGFRLSRRPSRAAVVGADYALAAWTLWGEVAFQGDRVDTRGERLGSYALLHVGARYRLARDVSLFARLSNATDRDYETIAGYRPAPRTVFVGVRYEPR